MCNRLKEQIIKILEDKRIASERDKEANERIVSLEEEIKKMGSDLREKCVEFSKEIKDLECANRRAEDEMEIRKKKFTDSECAKRIAEDEIEICKKILTELEWGKKRVEDEMEVWKKKFTDSECANRRIEDDLKEKCRELEIQASEMLNHGAELEDYKTKCNGSSTMLKAKEMECIEFEAKLKNLVLTKVSLDHELEDYKTTCIRMKDEITGLTNVGKIMSEREKTSHDRIAYFEELVKKMESDENCMLVQLKNENMVLECGLRRAGDGTENWKKRFTELEMGLGSSPKEVAYDDICEKYMVPFSSTMKRCKISDTSGSVSQEDDKCQNIKI